MAAYHKVEVALNKQSITVGSPSPQTVTVVVPNRGPKGDTGDTGPTGPANSLTIGTVTTGVAGSSASASITGTAPDQTLDLAIPRGDKGDKGDTGDTGATGATGPANSLTIGTVTTGAEGAPAAATITGDAPNQTLSLTIPVGATGATGPQGPAGTQTTDASELTSGTLADARLSANVPLLDAANTFTQNQTLNGTNNVAPNQTAASGASLMTRDLVDARAFFLQPWVTFSLTNFSGTGAFNTTGTANGGTVALTSSALYAQLATTSAADSTAAMWIDRVLFACIPRSFSGASPILDFDKPFSLACAFGVSLHGSANPRAGKFYFNLGNSRSVDSAGPLARKGVGFLIQDETITAQIHDGTSASNVGTSTDFLTADTDRDVLWLSLYNAGGGNVFYYVNGTQIASTTSGPTGTSTVALISVCAALLEESVGVGTGVHVANIQFAQKQL